MQLIPVDADEQWNAPNATALPYASVVASSGGLPRHETPVQTLTEPDGDSVTDCAGDIVWQYVASGSVAPASISQLMLPDGERKSSTVAPCGGPVALLA
ncbi:MAG: hypothetical protein ACRDV3_16875 [Acidothermaceae bacterium]